MRDPAIAEARMSGETEQAAQLKSQKRADIQKIRAETEEMKERIRCG